MIVCNITQYYTVHTYEICVWGGIFEKYLKLLRTTINFLLRIDLKNFSSQIPTNLQYIKFN